MSDNGTEKAEAPKADEQGVEQALYPEVELGGEPEVAIFLRGLKRC